MPEDSPNRDLAGLEASLKELAPAPAHLDRDRLLFRAGQLSARRGWGWPAAAAALAVLAGTLATGLVLRPEPRHTVETITRIVPRPLPLPRQAPPESPAPAPAPSEPAPPEVVARAPLPDGYLRLREQVLRWGADALPGPPALPPGVSLSRTPTPRDLTEWLPNDTPPSP